MPAVLETLERRTMLSVPAPAWLPSVYGTAALQRRHWTVIQSLDLTHDASAETLEIDGVSHYIVRDCTLAGGSTTLRILDSQYVILQRDAFLGAVGKPDPDGASVQLIRVSNAYVSSCYFRANPGHTEDLFSNFANVPTPGTVWVVNDVFHGHGPTNSGCSIVEDGPSPPPLVLFGDRIEDARCGFTAAAGNVTTEAMIYRRCGVDQYAASLYGTPVTVTAA